MMSNKRRSKDFERLAVVHLATISKAALRLTWDPLEAEDLAQEVFLRACRSFHRFKRGTNCKAWLFKILKNTSIDRNRSMRRNWTHVSLGDLDRREEGWDEGAETFARRGPQDLVISRLSVEKIYRAVEALPEIHRRTFILSGVEGFSYKEIAEIEDCPMGTIMSRMYRARRMLQTLLREHDPESDVCRTES